MYVYVLHRDGRPLMPTQRFGKVRRMLRDGLAVVVRRDPFTIRLTYETTDYVQDVDLGVDAGSKEAGVSACTKEKELYAAQIQQQSAFQAQGMARALRGSQDIGAHPPDPAGVLDPPGKTHHRGDSVLRPAAAQGGAGGKGTARRSGVSAGGSARILQHAGVRALPGRPSLPLLQREDAVLNVHHIESRQTGGDAPDNLVTLCRTCHREYHQGKIELPKSIARGNSFRDAAFMGIMRRTLLDRLKSLYPGMVTETWGYVTKNTRIRHGIEKTHTADARCISGHPDAEPLDCCYYHRFVRRHNRQLHKGNPIKGGIRKSNQAPKKVLGYCLNDRVRYKGTECFVHGRRTRGYFNLCLLDGTVVNTDAPVRDIRFISHSGTILTERRKQGPAA